MEESKQRERPEAIVLLEKVWPELSEANKTKLATMAETIAFMHEYGKSQRLREATA